MIATEQGPGPDKAKVKRNVDKMAAQGASADEIERYIQSEGIAPVADAPAQDGFTGGKGASGSTEPVPIGEGLGRSFTQGATLGFGDELRGALGAPLEALRKGKSLGAAYKGIRDEERDKQEGFEQQHDMLAPAAELAGSIPTSLLMPSIKSATAAGATYGGASALGHGEGNVEEQTRGAARGALAGGIAGRVGDWLGKGMGKIADKINPARVERRSLATLIPDDAASKFAERQKLTPAATVPGDLSPETAALSNQLGKSPKTAITGRQGAASRVAEVKGVRKEVGAEYDAKEQPLPIDDTIRALADRAGSPLDPEATTVPFSVLHRLRHDVAKMRASGMAKHDIGELRQNIDGWLQDHVEGLADIDSRYRTLTQHLGDALGSLKATKQGAVAAARRETGAGTRQANRMLSFWHALPRLIEPSPARKAEALQNVGFNPQTANAEMPKILQAQRNILNPTHPSAQVSGAFAGSLMAPQLSNDSSAAHTAALEMRQHGMGDKELAEQLSHQFTPNVVRFIVAKTTARLAQ